VIEPIKRSKGKEVKGEEELIQKARSGVLGCEV
jgi:hypothetical protein